MLKLKSVIKYQVTDFLKPVLVFYAFLYGIITIAILLSIGTGSKEVVFQAMEMNSIIFLIVFGVSTFNDDFKFLIQNGFTRKTIYLGSIIKFVFISFAMAVIETVITVPLYHNFHYRSFFYNSYGSGFSYFSMACWIFSLYTMILLISYACVGLMNRIGKRTFFLILISFIVIFLVLVPTINLITDGKLLMEVIPALSKMMGFVNESIKLINPITTFLSMSALAAGAAYFLFKKIEV